MASPSVFTVEVTDNMGRVVSTTTQAIVPSSVGITTLGSSLTLNNLWSFINSLQLITFLRFINVPSLPWNFVAFIDYLDVSLGDMPFMKSLPNLIRFLLPFNFTAYEETRKAEFSNPFIHSSSYEQSSLLLNFEFRFVAFVYYALFLSLVIILKRFCKDNERAVKFLSQFYSPFFFWRLLL